MAGFFAMRDAQIQPEIDAMQAEFRSRPELTLADCDAYTAAFEDDIRVRFHNAAQRGIAERKNHDSLQSSSSST